MCQGRTVVSPYVWIAGKQDGDSNGCISNYTTITRLGEGFARFSYIEHPTVIFKHCPVFVSSQ